MRIMGVGIKEGSEGIAAAGAMLVVTRVLVIAAMLLFRRTPR